MFEFGFFIMIFISTLSASFIVTLYFIKGMYLAIFEKTFWFTAHYGIALVFRFYHYIFRVDE